MLNSPGIDATRKFQVSDRLFSSFVALGAALAAYLIAVLAIGKIRGSHSLNPVYLTSDAFDIASLSQLQLIGFTLLVFGLLVFVLLRTSVLSDISEDILLLLGISAAGTGGSKVPAAMKRRLSFENWSWLRNQG